MHINYILVVGEEEETNGTIAVRNYKTKDQTVEKMSDVVDRLSIEIKNRSI
jgi:threonyl-tRNA synthetase